MCIAAGGACRKLLQPEFSPLSALVAHSKTLLYPSSSLLYRYIHPKSIGWSGYNATNPNCSETFQIPLYVSSEVKYREGFPTGPSHSSVANCIQYRQSIINPLQINAVE